MIKTVIMSKVVEVLISYLVVTI
jgi:hypothetical protein